MNFYKAFHCFFGEYRFKTDKKSFSRLANLISKKRLYIWDIKTVEKIVEFKTSIFSAESIADIADSADIDLEIIQKTGLPFIFSRYRKRPGILLGMLVGLFLAFYSQLFVWKITIEGNASVRTVEIETALSECGISVGSFIPSIDVERDSNLLLLNCRDISSAAISLNGTHLTLSVLERTETPEIVDTGGYYNVIAESDGVILDIDAAEGTPEVKEGDVVFKGELLINSFIKGTNGSYRPTHARGNVYAAVKENFNCEIPYQRVTKHYTGNTETKRRFFVLGKQLPTFGKEETSFEYFDAISTEQPMFLFGFIELPVKKYIVKYTEYILKEEPIGEETAESFAREALDDRLAVLDLEVLSCETEIIHNKEKGVCILNANAVLKQNIASEIPFELKGQSISERLPMARE